MNRVVDFAKKIGYTTSEDMQDTDPIRSCFEEVARKLSTNVEFDLLRKPNGLYASEKMQEYWLYYSTGYIAGQDAKTEKSDKYSGLT